MAIVAGKITGKVLVQVESFDPVEVGTIEIPIHAESEHRGSDAYASEAGQLAARLVLSAGRALRRARRGAPVKRGRPDVSAVFTEMHGGIGSP